MTEERVAFQIRTNKEELAGWKSRAKTNNVSLSDYVRLAINSFDGSLQESPQSEFKHKEISTTATVKKRREPTSEIPRALNRPEDVVTALAVNKYPGRIATSHVIRPCPKNKHKKDYE